MTDLRDCLDFTDGPEMARLKGTRIRVEDVVAQFQAGLPPEAIATYFASPPPVELVYAAVTYYLLNRGAYDEARRKEGEAADRAYEAYWRALPQVERDRQEAQRRRLRELKARFTKPDGRLDVAALRAHVAAERASQPAGSGA
ncbi:MAG: DUF433 domain-containing protein [Gemmataceae bacterium]|nr:DUF433 domain-containing protein [Gemmataceae bacterium]